MQKLEPIEKNKVYQAGSIFWVAAQNIRGGTFRNTAKRDTEEKSSAWQMQTYLENHDA